MGEKVALAPFVRLPAARRYARSCQPFERFTIRTINSMTGTSTRPLRTCEEPVLPADGNRPERVNRVNRVNRVLRRIVIDRQYAIGGVTAQCRPASQAIVHHMQQRQCFTLPQCHPFGNRHAPATLLDLIQRRHPAQHLACRRNAMSN